jgi:hypothetical protein
VHNKKWSCTLSIATLLGSRHSLVKDDDGDACLVLTLAMENCNGCSRMGIAQAQAMMMM